jgi:RND superfamily putative drug exporter
MICFGWLVLAVAGGATAGTTTNRLTGDFTVPGQPAFQTDAKIDALYHNGAGGAGYEPAIPVITLPSGQTVDTPGIRAQLATGFASVAKAIPNSRIVDYASTGDRSFVTSDGQSTFALVFTERPPYGRPDPQTKIQPAMAAVAPAGWRVEVTGINQLTNSTPSTTGPGTLAETLIGGLGALIVLIFVFGSFLAFLPLVIAAVSILTTFLLLLGLTHLTGVSFVVEFLIALIGLGVAIDYSLLVVTRWREERDLGRDNFTAVVNAMSTAGRAVVLSGLTVTIGLFALVVLPVPFLRSMGYGGVLIPLVSVGVAVTLLPVLLVTVGPLLDWPRIRHEATASRPWSAWARLVVRRRWLAAIGGFIALGALTVPLLLIQIGYPRIDALTQSGPAYQALQTLVAGGVPRGVLSPIDILARDGDTTTAPTVARANGVYASVAPATSDYHRQGTELITVLLNDEGSSAAGQDTIRRVRAAVAGDTDVFGIGGRDAEAMDFNQATYGNFPLMLSLIAILTFTLLARAFRSLVLALKAVVLNLLSLGAAYGILVVVWQFGHGSQALWGVPATGAVTFWVPVVVFAFLYGLSMDYEVFLLTRMREEYNASGSTATAVVTGIGRTGRLVTSAALILFLAFLSMSTTPVTDVRIMATGLGAGILLDATVIRSLLVPSLVALFGRYNWWLPGFAARLLRVEPSLLSPRAQPTAA